MGYVRRSFARHLIFVSHSRISLTAESRIKPPSLCIIEMMKTSCEESLVRSGLIPCLRCAEKHWAHVHAEAEESPQTPSTSWSRPTSFCNSKKDLTKFCSHKELSEVEAGGYTSAKEDSLASSKKNRFLEVGIIGIFLSILMIAKGKVASNAGVDAAVGAISPMQMQPLTKATRGDDKRRRSDVDIEEVNRETEEAEQMLKPADGT